MTRVKPVVRLTGRDGNAFAISWRNGTGFEEVRVLKRRTGGVCREAKAGDYDNLLRVCMRWADVV